MTEIALKDRIPQNIQATIKGMLFQDYSPDDLALLDQDVLEVSLFNGVRIEVGWYPENNPSGRFVIGVYRKNQFSPIRTPMESENPLTVARIIGDLASQYGQAINKATPVGYSSSTNIKMVQNHSLSGWCVVC